MSPLKLSFLHILPLSFVCYLNSFDASSVMEQDCGAFAADCVILCCCCECFMLQFFICIFFKIPRKLAQKMKKFVIRRLRGKKRRDAKSFLPTKEEEDCRVEEHLSVDGSRFSCMEDIEKMLQELSMEGEFVFGSFWRQGETSNDTEFGNSQYEIAEDRDHSLVIAHCTRCLIGFKNPSNEALQGPN